VLKDFLVQDYALNQRRLAEKGVISAPDRKKLLIQLVVNLPPNSTNRSNHEVKHV